jgi:hypothetical protein
MPESKRQSVAFDPNTITLAEGWQLEVAAGEDLTALLRSSMGRMMVAVWVTHLREHGKPMPWNELTSLRLVDASSSLSRSVSALASETPEA